MFESAEEKEAKRQAKLAEQAAEQRAEEERQRAAAAERAARQYAASPAGRAAAAKEAGERFFEIQLEVGEHVGYASLGTAGGEKSYGSSARALGEIEALGWRLEQVGYYFMLTGETSTAQFFGSGQNTAVSGVTVGVYLFRNTSPPAAS